MNCCQTDTTDTEASVLDTENAPAPKDEASPGCKSCGRATRPVTRKTVLLMLRPELLDRAGEGEYRFCTEPDCRVVYFTEDKGESFTTEDLRVRVGLKEKDGPIPLCYCFGFDERHAREEIALTGRCSIPGRISALIKQGMCACPERNPSGACCLGEVNRAVKRLINAMVESTQPV
ncbi:MAG TPA: hypothetical protein VJS44_01770 [Pyrinomonadaceae bacterium]|nr:hypothetical protein [Pyrinomonadaceae bacterium]